MNGLTQPTQRTVEPEAPAKASVPEGFRHLPWNEVGRPGDFVADERLALQAWEGLSGFQAGSSVRPIYRRKKTAGFRTTSIQKPKRERNAKHQ